MLSACSFRMTQQDIDRITASKSGSLNKVGTFYFECPGNFSFTTNIEGEMAWLFLPDNTISLPRISSASGTKYTNGLSTFWSKGNKARLELKSKVYKDCINNPKKAIWAHAKLKGVDYRALGNEPGWLLEITQENQLEFTHQYGQNIIVFSTSRRSIDQSTGKTTFHASENNHVLSVTIENIPCHDTMSDENFDTTVTLVLDDRPYQGCGRALH